MKTNILLIVLLFLSYTVSAQTKADQIEIEKINQLPEIEKCTNFDTYDEAWNCIKKRVTKHITNKINSTKIRKIVSRDIKNAFSKEDWEVVIDASILVDCRIGVILRHDKEWGIKYIETEYPNLESYLEGFFTTLPKIQQPFVYEGRVSDLVFNIPLKVQVTLK